MNKKIIVILMIVGGIFATVSCNNNSNVMPNEEEPVDNPILIRYMSAFIVGEMTYEIDLQKR